MLHLPHYILSFDVASLCLWWPHHTASILFFLIDSTSNITKILMCFNLYDHHLTYKITLFPLFLFESSPFITSYSLSLPHYFYPSAHACCLTIIMLLLTSPSRVTILLLVSSWSCHLTMLVVSLGWARTPPLAVATSPDAQLSGNKRRKKCIDYKISRIT